MPRDHRPARCAVVDEHPRPCGAEPQLHLFARVHQRQRAATKGAGGGVEVDIVRQRVGFRIDQRQLDVIVLVNDHQRARNRAIIGHRLNGRAVVVDDDLFFFDGQSELDHFRAARRDLLVCVHKRRAHQLHLAPRQGGQVGRRPHLRRLFLTRRRRGGEYGSNCTGKGCAGEKGATRYVEAVHC